VSQKCAHYFFDLFLFFSASYILAKNSDFYKNGFLQNFSDSGIMKYMKVIVGPDTRSGVVHNIYPEGFPVPEHMMNPNIGGWNKKCSHIYEYINLEVCPKWGRDTHEPNYNFQNKLHRQWITDGKNKEFVCPQGGTIIGAWDI